jgi:hypothetical protein
MANRLRPFSGQIPHISRSRALGGAIWLAIAVACTTAAACFVWAPGTTAAAIFASAGVLILVAVVSRL